jgi:hypothetical protein
MGTDNELLAEVRAVLREEVADVAAGPEMLAAVRRARTRRAIRFRLLVAAPVAAAVAAVAVVASGVLTAPPAQESRRQPPAQLVEPENAAYVKERTSKALDDVLDGVIHERAVVTGGDKYSRPGEDAVYERWLAADGSTFRLLVTVAGRPVVDLSRDRVADVYVDYREKVYRALPGSEPSAPDYDDVLTPREVQQAIARGLIKVDGPEQVNGKAAVKLYREPGKVDAPMDLWVDATTYLPVRWQLRQDGSAPFDVTWLPPTPEHLAQLTTVVPPGFTEQK